MNQQVASGSKLSKGSHIAVGISALIMGILLVTSGALGTTLYNSMDSAKGDDKDTQTKNQNAADSANIYFIVALVLGVALLFAIAIIYTMMQCKCKDGASSMVQISKEHAGIAVVVMIYLTTILLITGSSLGVDLFNNRIGTYKGGDDAEAVKANEDRAAAIDVTNIVFIVAAVLFFVGYTIYVTELHKAIEDKIKGMGYPSSIPQKPVRRRMSDVRRSMDRLRGKNSVAEPKYSPPKGEVNKMKDSLRKFSGGSGVNRSLLVEKLQHKLASP